MRAKKSDVFCLFVGIAVYSCASAALADEPPEFLKKITDKSARAGRGYLGDGCSAHLRPGQGNLEVEFLPFYLGEKHKEDYHYDRVRVIYSAQEKDIVAAFGLLYRVTHATETKSTLDWIPAKEAPGRVNPHVDSIFVPFRKNDRCRAWFRASSVQFLGVAKADGGKEEGIRGKLAIKVHSTINGRGASSEAIVKAGDIVLINEKGHKVRAVVPPDEKTRVFGWVELDAKPIPQADLVRDKMPFIQPEVKSREPPAVQKIRISSYNSFNPDREIIARFEGRSPIVSVGLRGYGMYFPQLSVGDIVAMAGCLYRVVPFGSPDAPLCFSWVADDEAPPGLAPQAGSLFVPLQKGGDGAMSVIGRGPTEVAAVGFLGHDKKADKKPLVARMVLGRMVGGLAGLKLIPTSLEFVVQGGDILLVAGKGYKVRAIVPADEKTRVRGWVELDANGIPEADLIRDKTPFVRPMPKDDQQK